MAAIERVKGKIPAMRCLRLTHVNLRVDRLAEAVRFYAEVMGLAAITRHDASGKGAWFRLGDQEIHLTEDAASQPRSQRHFAVDVADLAEARRGFEAAGVAIEKEETGRFWIRDPAGNRIELVQSR
jgi:glyoxylase I family protein